jgi:hypothetical protein
MMGAARGSTPSARTVNAAAGDYAITGDPLEWAAAQTAAQRSWTEFPYSARRYGTRGWMFTLSDSGWIATLSAMQPAIAEQRLRWLRELLVTRGMPSFLLERHLDILHEELLLRAPERAADHSVFAAAAAHFRDERGRVLSESDFRVEASGFDAAVRNMAGGVPNMGAVIVGTVADERLGIGGPARSAIAWASDPTTFSQPWIAAVIRMSNRLRAPDRGTSDRGLSARGASARGASARGTRDRPAPHDGDH